MLYHVFIIYMWVVELEVCIDSCIKQHQSSQGSEKYNFMMQGRY